MRTIAVINQKGGVGKTTTVANLGAAVAARGKDLCLIDLDPQGHLSLHYGIEADETTPTVYDILTRESTVQEASQMLTPNLWLIPSNIDLAAAESELAGEPNRENRLREGFAAQTRPHDFVLIDCPPSLGLLTLNALALADDVIIPLQPHFLALQGLGKLLETVELVQKHINPKIRVAGVVLCMFESVTRLATEVVTDLKEFFTSARGTDKPWSNARIFSTVVRRNIKLAECPSYGKTIFEYEPKSHGAKDYYRLAKEFVQLFSEKQKAEAPQAVPEPEPQEQTIKPVPVPVPPPYSLPVEPQPEQTQHQADAPLPEPENIQASDPQPQTPPEPVTAEPENDQPVETEAQPETAAEYIDPQNPTPQPSEPETVEPAGEDNRNDQPVEPAPQAQPDQQQAATYQPGEPSPVASVSENLPDPPAETQT